MGLVDASTVAPLSELLGSGTPLELRGLWLSSDRTEFRMVWLYPSSDDAFLWTGVASTGGFIDFMRRPVRRDSLALVLPGMGCADYESYRWSGTPTAVHNDNPWSSPRSRPTTDTRDVYFIQAVDGGPVKIGVAGSPRSRLAEIQRMSPSELRILAIEPGVGQKREAELHQRFADWRSHGEWFIPSLELASLVESLGGRVVLS